MSQTPAKKKTPSVKKKKTSTATKTASKKTTSARKKSASKKKASSPSKKTVAAKKTVKKRATKPSAVTAAVEIEEHGLTPIASIPAEFDELSRTNHSKTDAISLDRFKDLPDSSLELFPFLNHNGSPETIRPGNHSTEKGLSKNEDYPYSEGSSFLQHGQRAEIEKVYNRFIAVSLDWSILEEKPGVLNYPFIDRFGFILDEVKANGYQVFFIPSGGRKPLWWDSRGGWLSPDNQAAYLKTTEIILHTFDQQIDTVVSIQRPGEMIERFFLEPDTRTGWREYIKALQSVKYQFDTHLAVLQLVAKISSSGSRRKTVKTASIIPRRTIFASRKNSKADRERSASLNRLMNENWEKSVRTGFWQGKRANSDQNKRDGGLTPDYFISLIEQDVKTRFKLSRPGQIFTQTEILNFPGRDKHKHEAIISFSNYADMHDSIGNDKEIFEILNSIKKTEDKIDGTFFYPIKWPEHQSYETNTTIDSNNDDRESNAFLNDTRAIAKVNVETITQEITDERI